jgi:tRNA(His) 5'-end guanylyltransferase
MKSDALGDRMKVYEAAFRPALPRRLPVIIRVDGRAFHTFTRGLFVRPFDDKLRHAMADIAKFLCEEISGAKFAYTQSDEVSVLVTSDDKLETQPWFGNDLCKLVSLSAALATWKFREWVEMFASCYQDAGDQQKYLSRQSVFDGRAFLVPHDDVCNYFVWRQRDWERNSVQMAARAHFSQKQIQGLDNSRLQDKLWKEKKVNWNDYPVMHKRGACVVPGAKVITGPEGEQKVRGWKVDLEPPIFTKDRAYIEERFRWPVQIESQVKP